MEFEIGAIMSIPLAIVLCLTVLGSGAIIVFNLIGPRVIYDYWSLDSDDLPKTGRLAILRSSLAFGVAVVVMIASVVAYVELR
jgi:hypothetical protein